MNIERTQQVSPILSAERIASNHQTATLKLAKDQIEAEGQAALKLIQSVPQPNDRVGNHINLAV